MTAAVRHSLPAAASVALALALAALATAAAKPAPPAGADRVESFKVALDGDEKKERVLVYNLAALPGGEGPRSFFESWDRKRGEWKLKQQVLVNESPGNAESGLVEAWVGDLNRDGRVEIAVRDYVSPSFGEVLSIYRQKSDHALRFRKLQTVGGDRVKVVTKKHKPAALAVLLLAHHSPDGVEHDERWKWSDSADRWRCEKDCAERP